jgi:membrane fusion protein (multidrug efflux system)
MTSHTRTIAIERPISSAEAAPILRKTAPEAPAEGGSSAQQVNPDVQTGQMGTAPGIREASEDGVPAASRNRLRTWLFAGAGAAALALGAYYGTQYWTVGRFEVSTDDAYVQADNTTIAPRVSGYLDQVLVGDNEPVKAGQTLARIDQRDFTVALDQAKADVAASQAAVMVKRASLDIQQSTIEGANATLAVDRANEKFAQQEDKRYSDLASTGFGTAQNAQQAASRIAAASAAVQRDTAALASAIKQVGLLKAELAQAEATAAHNLAAERQAELNLGYASIPSPVDGVVGNRTLRVGQFVQAGTQLMSVVPAANTYIVANFKETQLTHVQPGQSVEIEVDTFPGRVAHGHVDSIAPASGQQFALLPPDNATGNFTKIVQRIPVRIILDAHSALSVDLRPGMSVTPTIDTRLNNTRVAAAPTHID